MAYIQLLVTYCIVQASAESQLSFHHFIQVFYFRGTIDLLPVYPVKTLIIKILNTVMQKFLFLDSILHDDVG